VRSIAQEGCELGTDMVLGTHCSELLRVVRVVIVYRLAQSLVSVRKRGIGSQYFELRSCEHVARSRNVWVYLGTYAQPARWRRRLLRLVGIPAPAKVRIIARPKALSLHALGALLVSHRHQGIHIGYAHLRAPPAPAAAARSILVVLVARISRAGGVPAPAFFREVARPESLALRAVVAALVRHGPSDALLTSGRFAGFAGGDAVHFSLE